MPVASARPDQNPRAMASQPGSKGPWPTGARWRVLGVNPGCGFPAGGGTADPGEPGCGFSASLLQAGNQPMAETSLFSCRFSRLGFCSFFCAAPRFFSWAKTKQNVFLAQKTGFCDARERGARYKNRKRTRSGSGNNAPTMHWSYQALGTTPRGGRNGSQWKKRSTVRPHQS